MPHDYTFQLSPGHKTRFPAGPYDTELQLPVYEIEVALPKHIESQIEIKQFLMGCPGNNIWVWDIHNKSTWIAFVAIKKDGKLVEIDEDVFD